MRNSVRVQRLPRAARVTGSVAALLTMVACASTQFDRYFDAHKWSDAASALQADSTVLSSESGLFKAATLYSSPDRPTYNPTLARELFERLLRTYPTTQKRQVVNDQLSLLYEIEKTKAASRASAESLRSRMAQLAADTVRLRASLDSVTIQLRAEQDQNGLLRKVSTRLENDLAELQSELNHLKAIDLGPRSRGSLSDTTARKPIRR